VNKPDLKTIQIVFEPQLYDYGLHTVILRASSQPYDWEFIDYSFNI